MAAYYLTREAHNKHRSTLKAVVLECAMMFAEDPSIAMYQKALDALSFPLKSEAVQDYPVETKKDKKYYLFPLTEYHDRWPSLRQKDFEKSHYDPNLYSRGYLYVARDFLDSTDYTKIAVPPLQTDAETDSAEFNPKALEYVIRLSDFCRENDSYAAVVYEGNVVHEEHAREGVPVCVELYGVQVESAGGETGNGSGVWIDRVNQSPDQEGINVVVYDTFMGQVLETATFDLDAEQ